MGKTEVKSLLSDYRRLKRIGDIETTTRIDQALEKIESEYKKLLYHTYIEKDPRSIVSLLYSHLFISESQYYRRRDKAFEQFAEAYR